MPDTIAVLGAGPGGMAVAAHAATQGHRTRLFEIVEFRSNIEPCAAQGGVRLHCELHGTTLVPLDLVTTDIAHAVSGADIVFCVVPCYGQRHMAELTLPHLTSGQIFCYIGEGGGALEFRRIKREMKIAADVSVGEMNTLPFLARPLGPGTVTARSKRGGVFLAGLPHSSTARLVDRMKPYWPFIEAGETVLETVLLNFNAIDHVATVLTNIGTLESRQGPMLLWGEGATPSVVRCIEGVDNEIVAIRRTLGFGRGQQYREWLSAQGFTDRVYATTYDAIHQSPLERSLFNCGAQALQSRYITEDVPYALVLISSIGRAIGTPTPVIDALITIASVANVVDYRTQGRTLESVGFTGRGRESLLGFVN